MNVLVVLDSFKECLTSKQCNNAVEESLNKFKNINVYKYSLSDGGEGLLDSINLGTIYKTKIHDPLGNIIECEYLIKDNTCIIESAKCIGLGLISKEKRNPLYTSSYPLGELILHIINKHNCYNFTIGLGGSSTNDGGVGMLSALGFKFLDSRKNTISLGSIGLENLSEINISNVSNKILKTKFTILNDVNNPLCGPNGCSHIYSKQKGAEYDDILKMDKWLYNYAQLTKNILSNDYINYPGSGAAGGLGFAFKSYLNAELLPGIEYIINLLNIEKIIANCDIVITGEGKIDNQTSMGKVISGLYKLCSKHNKKLIALAGIVENRLDGIECYQISNLDDDYMDPTIAYKNIENTVYEIFSKMVGE